MRRATLGMAALAAAAALTGAAAESAPLAVDSERGAARWNRVFTQAVPLAWDWEWRWVPAEAAQVTLRIEGANHATIEQTFQKPVTTYVWNVCARPADFREDTYEATLTFSDAAGTPLASKSARLDALAGAFTGVAVTTTSTNGPAWRRVRNGAFIPYDRAWSPSAAPGARATLAWTRGGERVREADLAAVPAGLHPWPTGGWPRGDYELELAFGGTPARTALVSLFPEGTAVILK